MFFEETKLHCSYTDAFRRIGHVKKKGNLWDKCWQLKRFGEVWYTPATKYTDTPQPRQHFLPKEAKFSVESQQRAMDDHAVQVLWLHSSPAHTTSAEGGIAAFAAAPQLLESCFVNTFKEYRFWGEFDNSKCTKNYYLETIQRETDSSLGR